MKKARRNKAVVYYEASVEERGNGFADLGDYVVGGDENVYRVVKVGTRIETRGCGEGNICFGYVVERADWSDVDDDTEPTCSALIGSEVSYEQATNC
jgi:hypothetical protein